jgi:hypothetical protein
MIARIKALVAKVVARKDVQSVARHAVIAAGAVLLPVLVAGTPVSVALLVTAGAAALRVVWLAVQAKLAKAAA